MKKNLIASRVGAFWLEGEQITPFEYDEAPNELIYSYLRKINHPCRIKRPCIRKGFLQNNKNRSFNDEFIEVPWDEALDLIALNLKKTYDLYGSSGVYAESYEWGGVGKIGWGRTLMQRLIRCLGGGVFEMGDYSTGAGIVMVPHIFNHHVYAKPTDFKAVIENAEIIVFWGANPFVTGKIAHDIPMHEHEKYLHKIAKKAIFIDTFINDSAKKMNAKSILIRANTDIAMMIAMCHHLYTKDLYDKAFIADKTYGFDDFKDYFLGKNDGTPKNVSWASKICGISEEIIKNLAENLASKKSFISLGRALQRQHNGELSYLAISAFAAMCGHIGKDGLGVEFNQTTGCKGEISKNTKRLKGMDELLAKPNSQDFYIPSSRLNDALLNPGKSVFYNGEKLSYPKINLLINACGSYFTHQPNANESLKAWQKPECIITLEPFWNAQAKLSDIVLPIALEGERYDIEQSSNKEIIFALKPIKQPFYEAKSDFEICKEIAKRFNKSYEFCQDLDELSLVKMSYECIAKEYLEDEIILPSFDEFLKRSFVKIPNLKANPPYTNHKNISKINLKIDKFDGLIAKYEPSDEFCNEFCDENYLRLSTPHSPNRLHSQLDNAITKENEPAYINPSDAKKHGIKTGELIKVFNKRGAILCEAMLSDDVKIGNIIIYQGAWWDEQNGVCLNGNVNVLTSSKPCSQFSHSNIAHTCAVKIEKFNEKYEKSCFKAPIIHENKLSKKTLL